MINKTKDQMQIKLQFLHLTFSLKVALACIKILIRRNNLQGIPIEAKIIKILNLEHKAFSKQLLFQITLKTNSRIVTARDRQIQQQLVIAISILIKVSKMKQYLQTTSKQRVTLAFRIKSSISNSSFKVKGQDQYNFLHLSPNKLTRKVLRCKEANLVLRMRRKNSLCLKVKQI